MKLVLLNGSPRRDGNTRALLEIVARQVEQAGMETELLQVGGVALRGCNACGLCKERKDQRCSISSDQMNIWIEKIFAADGVVIGSPTYFADVTTEVKALIDRCGYVARANDFLLRRKVGAAVVAVRRAGAIHALDTIHHFFGANDMITVGSTYWNLGVGRDPGQVHDDEEGVATMETLGQNITWLLNKIGK